MVRQMLFFFCFFLSCFVVELCAVLGGSGEVQCTLWIRCCLLALSSSCSHHCIDTSTLYCLLSSSHRIVKLSRGDRTIPDTFPSLLNAFKIVHFFACCWFLTAIMATAVCFSFFLACCFFFFFFSLMLHRHDTDSNDGDKTSMNETRLSLNKL